MKPFQYAHEDIGMKDMIMTVSSMIVGIGVLTLPRTVSVNVKSPDGWIAIAIAGVLAMMLAWLAGWVGKQANGTSFIDFSIRTVGKPFAYAFAFVYCTVFLLFTAYEVRAIAVISKQYLFEKTPLEVIALVFLLVVVQGVLGSRVGIIRLNSLFLPIVLFVSIVLLVFAMRLFHIENLKPLFTSGPIELLRGVREGIFSLLGFDVIMFYAMFMKNPKEAPKAAVIGVLLPTLFYLIVFVTALGVFSYQGASQIMYPTIEMAKEVQIPGEFFERFESLFFTVWIMTVFNTTCMAFDVGVTLAAAMGKRFKRTTWIFILTPVAYYLSMQPRNIVEFTWFGDLIAHFSIVLTLLVPISLSVGWMLRGRGSHAR